MSALSPAAAQALVNLFRRPGSAAPDTTRTTLLTHRLITINPTGAVTLTRDGILVAQTLLVTQDPRVT
jgi:hypothetical protein